MSDTTKPHAQTVELTLPERGESLITNKVRYQIPRQIMPEQASEERAKNFSEVALGLETQAVRMEALRCIQCKDRNCVEGCPVGIAIPEFVKKVAEGDFGEAVRILKRDNVLPAVCGRVCPQEEQHAVATERAAAVGHALDDLALAHHHHLAILQRDAELVVLADADATGTADVIGKGKVLPVYPATEGLSHKIIRGLIDRHLEELLRLSVEALPAAEIARVGLIPIGEALRAVHRPATLDDAEAGRRRLAFDELLDLQLMLSRARLLARRCRAGIRFEVKRTLTTQLREALPWDLTGDQKQALREITADMTSPERMHRLLMGDVGTGKTVMALFAMLVARENGYPAAMMAPTVLLAEQHAATLTRLLAPLGLVPELLLGRMAAGKKAAVRQRLVSGEAGLVVGTHALVQEGVDFHRHRLAVEHVFLFQVGPDLSLIVPDRLQLPRGEQRGLVRVMRRLLPECRRAELVHAHGVHIAALIPDDQEHI